MFRYAKCSRFLLACSLALAGILFSVLVPAPPVRADVGVQPVLPGGSSIQPDISTAIQMVDETVTINVRAATEEDNALLVLNPEAYGYDFLPIWFSTIADVEADFTMRNPTSDDVTMTVWFPLASALKNADWNLNPNEIVPRIEGLQVRVNGVQVDYSVTDLPNPNGTNLPSLPWANFTMTFAASQVTAIHISYTLPLQPGIKGSEDLLYYVFQTGAGWDGTIGHAELIVNLPYPASVGTIASIPSGKLYIPYMTIPRASATLPEGVIIENNQARWVWNNFEPGPEDDFAIYVLRPDKWQQLENARAATRTNPKDGQAWLNLAYVYQSLSFNAFNFSNLLFGATYFPQCTTAFQKAVALLPEHPSPHAGLALVTLIPYLPGKNAPPEVMRFIQDEYQTARELSEKFPILAPDASNLIYWFEEALSNYNHNDATATMEAVTQEVFHATYWAERTLNAGPNNTAASAKSTRIVCYATYGPACDFTATPTLRSTPKPDIDQTPYIPTVSPTAETEPTGSGKNQGILIALVVIGLAVVGYLIYLIRVLHRTR